MYSSFCLLEVEATDCYAEWDALILSGLKPTMATFLTNSGIYCFVSRKALGLPIWPRETCELFAVMKCRRNLN